MEFSPVENPVADEAIAGWREEHYSTDLSRGPDSPAEIVLGQVDDLLGFAQHNVQCVTESDGSQNIQYTEVIIEENGIGSTALVSLDIAYQHDEQSGHDEYVIAIDRSDETSSSLYGSRYAILCPNDEPPSVLVQRTVDGFVAELFDDSEYFEEDSGRQWLDATEYDVKALSAELAELQKLASQQTSDDA